MEQTGIPTPGPQVGPSRRLHTLGGAFCRFTNLKTLRTTAMAGGCATETRLPHGAPRTRGCPDLRAGQPGPTPQGAWPRHLHGPHVGPGRPGEGRLAGPWGRGTGKHMAPRRSPPHPALAFAWLPRATGHGPRRSLAFPPSLHRVSEMPQTQPSDLPGSSLTRPLQHPAALCAPLPCLPCPSTLANSQALRWEEAVPPNPPG